ncbi:MAG: nitrate/nitrite transporter NrtS [Mycobacterium sp.]|uniref:nitrate/nitrite transporter NrtS n=1 Tax=Mycobacterium sp. TaxID=1785 RepID=UPI0026018566|nr:nitrate/nitrite transporter NrtS [Mycobacterium sp.]MDI3313377.1 nitrate/nitrite transporter NrtS [Mycobacterium sp.]
MADTKVTPITWERPVQALGLFLRGRTLRAATPTALIVGTVLCVVNQGGVLLSGEASTATWVRMAINYIVPLIVASIGYLSACRKPRQHGTANPSDR